MRGTKLLNLLAMCKRYNERPSKLLAVGDSYAAYCLDEAYMYILCRIENEGRLPRELERLTEPASNKETVEYFKGMKGVRHIDYRRHDSGISDTVN